MKHIHIIAALLVFSACANQSAEPSLIESQEKKENKIIIPIPKGEVAEGVVQQVPMQKLVPAQKIQEKSELLTNEKMDEELLPVKYVKTYYEDAILDFDHSYSKSAHPFIAATLIDVQDDGVDEVFLGGGVNQEDVLFVYEDGELKQKQVFAKTAASYGATSIDVDNDGDTDVMVSRQDGIYILENNQGVLSEQKTDITLDSETVALSVTHGDYNRDGWVDLYLSTMKTAKSFKTASFNNPSNYSQNKLFAGSKEGFKDVTEETKTGLNQNSFTASFIDLDGDTWQDLVVAQNTDKVAILHNNKGVFEAAEVPNKYGFWMGLAVDDFNNDAKPDLLFSNIGTTISTSIAKGDSRADQPLVAEYLYLENQGSLQFADKTQEYGFTDLGFGWGLNFADLNLDGERDVVVAQSYVKWPPHKLKKLPGAVLEGKSLQDRTKDWGLENKAYGITQLLSDFNQDGTPDVVFANIDGKAQFKLSQGQENNYIALDIADTVQNNGLHIQVSADDVVQHIFHGMNTGMGSESHSSKRSIGIGKAEEVMIQIFNPQTGKEENFLMKANTIKEIK